MNVSNIVHTRTFHCDFNPKFLLRPDDFDESEIKWARQFVLAATASIDNLHGVRWLVADNGKHRMVGIVCFVHELAKQARQSNQDAFFVDERGRSVYAFVGFVWKSGECAESLPTYTDFWDVYRSCVAEKWERTVAESTLSPYSDRNFSGQFSTEQIPSENKSIGEKTFFESVSRYDEILFSYYVQNISQKSSFCSNLTDFSAVKTTPFSIVSTSQNVISRFEQFTKEEMRRTEEKRRESTPIVNTGTSSRSDSENLGSNKKKSSKSQSPIGWPIILVIILLVLGAAAIAKCTQSNAQTGTTQNYQSSKKN